MYGSSRVAEGNQELEYGQYTFYTSMNIEILNHNKEGTKVE
jgi:hypothetical protein